MSKTLTSVVIGLIALVIVAIAIKFITINNEQNKLKEEKMSISINYYHQRKMFRHLLFVI